MPSTRGTLWWDFDATLVSRPLMWTEVARRLLDRHSPGHGVPETALNDDLATGMPWHRPDHAHPDLVTPELWWQAVDRRYGEVFDALGCRHIPADAGDEMRADILDTRRYTIFDDVVPALTRASAGGWRNMIVSNHVPELAALVHGLGLAAFFEVIVSSGVVGYEKPHRLLFEAARRHVPPGDPIWMIGDNHDADCVPVRALGMKAVLVRNPANASYGHQAAGLLEALDIIGAAEAGK